MGHRKMAGPTRSTPHPQSRQIMRVGGLQTLEKCVSLCVHVGMCAGTCVHTCTYVQSVGVCMKKGLGHVSVTVQVCVRAHGWAPYAHFFLLAMSGLAWGR